MGGCYTLAALPVGKSTGTHCRWGWASLHGYEEEKISCLYRGLNLNHPARNKSLYWLHTNALLLFLLFTKIAFFPCWKNGECFVIVTNPGWKVQGRWWTRWINWVRENTQNRSGKDWTPPEEEHRHDKEKWRRLCHWITHPGKSVNGWH